jgi:hypothetical protein
MAHIDHQGICSLAAPGLASIEGFAASSFLFGTDLRCRVHFDRGLTQICDLNPMCKLLSVAGPCMIWLCATLCDV